VQQLRPGVCFFIRSTIRKGIFVNSEDKLLTDFWNVLNLTTDYLKTGSIVEHSELEINSDSLEKIAEEISVCTNCQLCNTRTTTVPGHGSVNPSLMIIGEGPGADEDKTGKPFVGRAGKYLDKWLDAIGLLREENVFLANIVKCRPPENRDPLPEEVKACLPFLERQVDLLKPGVILTVGRISSQIMTGHSKGIGRMRGEVYNYNGFDVIPTYHPSAVLRNPDDYRKPVWEDLQKVRSSLDTKSSK
jgi:uracil-DNA glycosylase